MESQTVNACYLTNVQGELNTGMSSVLL